jgi:DNA mismatch repair protein MutL
MTIHILPPEVAAKIAAGEVVERPANAAKELIENSLDAGATDIRIEVREGGRRLLRITDNGHGIPAAEAPLAFARHATSKLRTVDDLNHIATFGFRGEALYSIAAVSQFTLTTRARGEEYAVTLRLEGGVLAGQSKSGAPVGTVVSVENLFYNVPARQKFMRAAATEAGQISAVVQRFALVYPACRFSYLSEGRLLFQSTGSGNPFDVLVKVLGLENARQMTPIGTMTPAATSAGAALLPDASEDISFMADVTDIDTAAPSTPTGIRVTGFTSLPTLTRANRSAIDLFVNRRYVEDRSLTHAVVQAYHTLLPVGRYPRGGASLWRSTRRRSM